MQWGPSGFTATCWSFTAVLRLADLWGQEDFTVGGQMDIYTHTYTHFIVEFPLTKITVASLEKHLETCVLVNWHYKNIPVELRHVVKSPQAKMEPTSL